MWCSGQAVTVRHYRYCLSSAVYRPSSIVQHLPLAAHVLQTTNPTRNTEHTTRRGDQPMRLQPPPAAPPRLPTALDDIRSLLRTLDVTRMQDDVQREANTRLAIVGPVNSGKS